MHFTANWAKLPFLATLRARHVAKPIVLVEHSYTAAYEHRFARSPLRFRTMLRAAYGLASRVVAVSHGQARWMVRSSTHQAREVACRAVDDRYRAAARHSRLHDTPNGPLRLGAYGRYCEQKGFATLIEAMNQIAPDVATLHVCGLGPGRDDLAAAARHLPHVTIDGPVQISRPSSARSMRSWFPLCGKPSGRSRSKPVPPPPRDRERHRRDN